MYSEWGWLLPLGGVIWLGVLSFFVWQEKIFLKDLFPKSSERDIRKKFEEVQVLVKGFDGKLEKLDGELKVLSKNGLRHIQRVELLRYNPYGDTGGDQSFSVAMLDDQGDGVVLTSLHSRSETRVYSKPVKEGKIGKYQFSKEEEEVVRKAMQKS